MFIMLCSMNREKFLEQINYHFRVHPIVAILGPRQVGKTTLAMQYKMENGEHFEAVTIFDLENPMHIARLENPLLALDNLRGLIIIDEIQRMPSLFPILRVIADKNHNQKFLILGSASPSLIKNSAETLAGRISYIELTPFSLIEAEDFDKLWIRGGYPKSYLATDNEISFEWRRQYIRTFLEQDIPSLGIRVAENVLRRFWTMISHYHGNILNYSELAKSLRVSDNTIRHYFDILENTFMVRQLKPWHANISKRQVKSPKIYFRDSGILHFFLNVTDIAQLENHPKLGNSWEGFAVEEIINRYNADKNECYFWATHAGAELDLIIVKNGKFIGFEVKYTDSPKITKSINIALQDLALDEINIVYPGKETYSLGDKINVIHL